MQDTPPRNISATPAGSTASGKRTGITGPLRNVVGPFARTGGFYARAWGDYLDRQPGELPVAWLHEGLGLNVVLPVLPMHGPRARNLPKAAAFPGEDLLDNVHGSAQAVWDIRRLLSWIRLQEPDLQSGLVDPSWPMREQ